MLHKLNSKLQLIPLFKTSDS